MISREKAFDKIPYSFMIKIHSKLGIEGNIVNLIKGLYKTTKTTANIITNSERLNVFPPRLRSREGSLLSPFLFNNELEVLASAIDKKKI